MPAVETFVAWPRRLRIFGIVVAAVLCSLTVVWWFALPANVRRLFTLSQLLTLLAVVGLIVAVIIGVLLIRIVLKLIKIAIVVALCVGIYMLAQNKFGAKRLK